MRAACKETIRAARTPSAVVRSAGLATGGFFARALRLALPCFAACAAAVLAHVAIDVAGDYVLPTDAYDALGHGSRWSVSLLALCAAAGGLWALVRAAVAETRGAHGALREVVRAALPASPARFVAVVALASVPILVGMAGLDAAVAGRHVDELADLVGGSFALAGVMTGLCATLTALGTLAFLRVVCRHRRALLRVVEAFLRLAFAFTSDTAAPHAHRHPRRPRVHSALRRCTSGNRAPPALLA